MKAFSALTLVLLSLGVSAAPVNNDSPALDARAPEAYDPPSGCGAHGSGPRCRREAEPQPEPQPEPEAYDPPTGCGAHGTGPRCDRSLHEREAEAAHGGIGGGDCVWIAGKTVCSNP